MLSCVTLTVSFTKCNVMPGVLNRQPSCEPAEPFVSHPKHPVPHCMDALAHERLPEILVVPREKTPTLCQAKRAPRAAFPSACLAAQTKRWAEGIRVPAPLALLTLGFFISSFSNCFRCRVRLFTSGTNLLPQVIEVAFLEANIAPRPQCQTPDLLRSSGWEPWA